MDIRLIKENDSDGSYSDSSEEIPISQDASSSSSSDVVTAAPSKNPCMKISLTKKVSGLALSAIILVATVACFNLSKSPYSRLVTNVFIRLLAYFIQLLLLFWGFALSGALQVMVCIDEGR